MGDPINRDVVIRGLGRTSPDDQLGQLREKAEFVANVTGQDSTDSEIIQENLDKLVTAAKEKVNEPEVPEYPPQDI